MPRFLSTMQLPIMALGICDRCGFKFPLMELFPDPNYPGMRVDKRCVDVLDPYTLPARGPDNFQLPFVRPDVVIDVNAMGLYTPDGAYFLTSVSGATWLVP